MIELPKASNIHMLKRVALSWGLVIWVMLVAPFCWGLMLSGYNALNNTETIENNPCFTIFMRMATSCVWVIIVAGVIAVFCVISKDRKVFWVLFRKTIANLWWRPLIWLMLMSFCFFGARACEMRCILTYSFAEKTENKVIEEKTEDEVIEEKTDDKEIEEKTDDKDEFEKNVSKIQKENGYLRVRSDLDKGVANKKPSEPNMQTVKARTAEALHEYGYFMGLMFVLLLAVKWNIIHWVLSAVFRRKSTRVEELSRLQSGRMTFIGKIFWVSTLFLTIASGVLNIVAREPLYVWPYIANMTGIAFIVALWSSLEIDFKLLGDVNVDIDKDKDLKDCKHKLFPPIVASIVVTFFQVTGTAILAFTWWFFIDDGKKMDWAKVEELAKDYLDGLSISTIRNLVNDYRDGFSIRAIFERNFINKDGALYNWIYIVVIIGFLGSVVAPIAQLFGVYQHNKKLKDMDMTRYGVNGNDWLIIGEGFEPMFVIFIYFIFTLFSKVWPRILQIFPASNGELICLFPIFMAVVTVLIIALLRIAEVLSEKNSALRNAIFTDVRGSTQDTHEEKGPKKLCDRAIKLSLLKFYDKRRELALHKASFMFWDAINEGHLPNVPSLPFTYLAFLVDGQYYFTQDDPFTSTVLDAYELYLKRKYPDVEVVSLKRFLVNGKCRIDDSVWEGKQRIDDAVWKRDVRPFVRNIANGIGIVGDDAMPYVLVSKNRAMAEAYAREWSGLLEEVSEAVRTGDIDLFVNGMIIQKTDEK